MARKVQNSRRSAKLVAALITLALITATAALAAGQRSNASDTLVFGASADPVSLDGSLINDGESIRVVKQIVQTLVAQSPGTTNLIPQLATKWTNSPNGKVWTFQLRDGVSFHDGTPFNAKAVCFNFDRWYNYTGPLQNSSVSYYYNLVFGGFKTRGHREERALQELQGEGLVTAVITLTQPFGPFLGALDVDPVRHPEPHRHDEVRRQQGHSVGRRRLRPRAGPTATQHPTGTGPFKFESWTRRRQARRSSATTSYWGKKAYPAPAHLPADRGQRGTAAGAADG